MSILSKLIIVNTISNKIPAGYFTEIGKLIRKFNWKGKCTRIYKGILKKWKRGKVMDSYYLVSRRNRMLQ